MDTPKAVTHIGLCAGYGGIELGLHRAIRGMRTVALCEIEAFAIANLVAKMEAGLMDPAPVWPDLKTFPWAAFRDRVDILTGGYPCQPFSSAGKRAGKEDPRHLWPWIADGIRLLRPRCCFFENVEGHISLGLSDVIEDLAGMGYRTTWGIFSASEVGAPHQRKRVFILAYDSSKGSQGREWLREAGAQRTSSGHPIKCSGSMAVSSSLGGASGLSGPVPWHEGLAGEPDDGGHQAWPSRPGEQQYGWEPPRVVADSHRIDRSAQAEGREHDRQAGPAGEAMGDTEGWEDNGRGPRDMEGEAREGGCGDNAADGSGEELADNIISGCDRRSDGTSGWSRESGEAGEDASGWRSESHGMRQTQPPLGGDPDGASGGMDYAELCVSGDNRTDELRLLGNGVVPATAERAFRALIEELI